MNDSQNVSNVSKAEWLCAALIDFLPIAILTEIPTMVNMIAGIVSYCTREPGSYSWHTPSLSQTVFVVLMILSALYLLLKDSFGFSLGKRIMGIKLQKEENDASMALCLLRNLILALFYVRCFIFVVNPDTTNFFLRNLFLFYCIAELLCVNFTNRTIGDNICQLQLVKRENYVPTKVNDHTFCIIAIIILCSLTIGIFMPFYHWKDVSTLMHDHDFRKLYYLNMFFVPALVKSMVYSFLLFKLIKPKAFRWTAIVFIVLIECGIALKYVHEIIK